MSTLTIVLSSDKIRITDVSGAELTVFSCAACLGDKPFSHIKALHQIPKFHDLEMLFLFGDKFKHLNGTQQIYTAVENFLRDKHGRQDVDYDCYSFVNEYLDVPQHKKIDMLQYWELGLARRHPKAGDVVFLVSNPSMFHHAAIYVGFGRYISVYGAGGDLEFSTLGDMMKDFKAELVFRAVPKD